MRMGKPAAGRLAVHALTGLIGLLLLFAPFLFPDVRAQEVAARICVFIVLVASYDLLIGYTGIVSFAHTMFFGLGAYGTAMALKTMGPGSGGVQGCTVRPAIRSGSSVCSRQRTASP